MRAPQGTPRVVAIGETASASHDDCALSSSAPSAAPGALEWTDACGSALECGFERGELVSAADKALRTDA